MPRPSTPHTAAQHALLPVAVGAMYVMYATDRHQTASDTHHRLMPAHCQGGGILSNMEST